MLSSEEYELLKPFIEAIKQSQVTGKFNGNGFTLIDHIRQKHGCRPVCFSCDGDKIEALKDIFNYIVFYEENL